MNSRIKLLAFFVIEPAMLFFDSQFLYVYYPEKRDFKNLNISQEFRGIVTPARYFMKVFQPKSQPKNMLTHLLFYQEDKNRFGVSQLYSNLTYSETHKFMNETEKFLNIDDQIFLKRPKNLMQVPWEIF